MKWSELGAVVAAYLFVVFVLCPGTPFISFPVHHDDFSNLSHIGYIWYPWRPVSYGVLIMLSRLGIPVYYSALHVLIVVYAFLSIAVLRRLLDVPSVPALVLLPVAAAALSFENTVEYSKYTGLITNLLSGVFAMIAMTAMVSQRKPAQRLGFGRISLVWISAALSFWSKEDFLAPTILLAAYLLWRSHAGRRGWYILLSGLVVEAALLLLYNHHMQSVFTQSSSGSYRPDFSPVSILKTAYTYILLTPGTKAAFLLAACALVWNRIASNRIPWIRLLAFLAIIASMALPYLALPNHVFSYYAFNWAVWEAGGGLLVLWRLWPGMRSGAAIAILAAACLFVTQSGRTALSEWYSEAARLNRNISRSLAAHRSRLDPYPAVAVEGAPMYGPWFGATGDFLKNRLRMDHVWLVRVPKDSAYWRASWALLGSDIQGDVKTVAMETEPVSTDMPLVKLSKDGMATVDYPREP
jgi:hypothetical protein